MRRRSTLLLLTMAAGCLPRGGPPAGKQLLSTRNSAHVTFVPDRPGQPRRLLAFEELQPNFANEDVYIAEVSSAGAGPLRLLAHNVTVPVSLSCQQGYSPCSYFDSHGRLLLRGFSPVAANGDASLVLQRLDPATGTLEMLDPGQQYDISPSGDRIVVQNPDSATASLRDADGKETKFPNFTASLWFGEDFFYVVQPPAMPERDGGGIPTGTLFVLRADGTITQITDQVQSLQAYGSGPTPVLVIQRRVGAGPDTQYVVVDPVTLALTTVATTHGYANLDFSPDGHWAAITTATNDDPIAPPRWKLTMLDRRAGTSQDFDIDLQQGIVAAAWRPGHDEAWFTDYIQVFIWRPTTGVTKLPLATYLRPQYGRTASSPFTTDGAHCFVRDQLPIGSDGQFFPVYLASADDPMGPRVRLNPPGSGLADLRELDDGQILIRTWTTLPERGDIYLVDARQGVVRPVTTGAMDVDVGQGRLLALRRLLDRAGTGDLTLIDLVTSAETRLGENASGPTTDFTNGRGLGPGAPLAFAVHSALPSPYDGLWLTVLP